MIDFFDKKKKMVFVNPNTIKAFFYCTMWSVLHYTVEYRQIDEEEFVFFLANFFSAFKKLKNLKDVKCYNKLTK